ncbi:ComF family protein [Variovorax paradoxus]|uniref:ComF family protein n=1 Tax=Variovorax paradoxus TaxID=34073 RepID=UPI001E1A1D91|nr:ComF family protein [Variovorax paradoxus]MBW8717084.1 ComF family protein [Variovorax paradoxus]MBW8892575.1 ComF family protein [Burkholderiales bacterium]
MFSRWADRPLTSLLARLPSQCEVCRAWPSRRICDACVARFAPPAARCGSCALPVPEGVARCSECMRDPPPLDACFAACAYAWPWPDCIAQFKFHGEAGWAGPLATLMRSVPWVEPALEQCDRVLPMPMAPARLRERGFNQALELARRLAPAKTDAALLLRTRETPAQSGLARAERLGNLRGAFAVEPLRAHELQGRRVVLVDDVMTSGASLFAAAAALRLAGAAHVTALVFARTDPPH